MLARSQVPFNISILNLTPQKLSTLRPVRVLDMFDGASTNFHPDGLFSTLIFGKVGDPLRSKRFSYIDVKIPVFHPIIYRALASLKELYAGIMAGTEYAIWNPEIKDFERVDPIKGKTGYEFFVSKWMDIEFKETDSIKRQESIKMLNKYRPIAMTSKVVVMPAALRDAEYDRNGRVQQHEINLLYVRLLSTANTISDTAAKTNLEILNTARYSLQQTFNDVYNLLSGMIEGKKKLITGKWAARRIMYGTRNVITAMNTTTAYLGAPGNIGFNNTIVGLYEGLKSILPVARFMVKSGFLSKVFIGNNAPARLVNKKTLHVEDVQLKSEHYDRWMTDEGLEKIITSFGDESLRDRPLEIDNHYLGLIYKGPDKTFKIIQDIDDVPATRSKKDVMPLTFCELLYLSGYWKWNTYPLFITRYPVTGTGSVVPSLAYMKTTIKSEQRRELDDNWAVMAEDRIAYEFPIPGPYVNSASPHTARIAGMDADFDGDTSSVNMTYSNESVKEVHNYMQKRIAYIGANGRFLASTNVDTVALTLYNLTGE